MRPIPSSYILLCYDEIALLNCIFITSLNLFLLQKNLHIFPTLERKQIRSSAYILFYFYIGIRVKDVSIFLLFVVKKCVHACKVCIDSWKSTASTHNPQYNAKAEEKYSRPKIKPHTSGVVKRERKRKTRSHFQVQVRVVFDEKMYFPVGNLCNGIFSFLN